MTMLFVILGVWVLAVFGIWLDYHFNYKNIPPPFIGTNAPIPQFTSFGEFMSPLPDDQVAYVNPTTYKVLEDLQKESIKTKKKKSKKKSKKKGKSRK